MLRSKAAWIAPFGLASAVACAEPVTVLDELQVIATAPVSGSEIAADKIPSKVETVTGADMARRGDISLSQTLERQSAAVTLNTLSGNDLQPSLSYRGFDASPVPGATEGLAVYLNGARINEAFGDTVNWDLIPSNAIDRTTLFPNNPIFGLNALGGALSIVTRTGFSYQGFELDLRGGSYGRRQIGLQHGKTIGNWATYVALETFNDNGWRRASPSQVRRGLADLGYRAEGGEYHLTLLGAQNRFGAAATTPVEMLARNWGSVYTTPQSTRNELAHVALSGTHAVSDTWKLDGNLYVRNFRQAHVDGNTLDYESCRLVSGGPRIYGCQQDDDFLIDPGLSFSAVKNLFVLRDPTGTPILNSTFGNSQPGTIDRTWTTSQTVGGSLQATGSGKLFDRANQLVIGTSLSLGRTSFKASSELGTIGPDLVVNGFGFNFYDNVPGGYSPVSLKASNTYFGIYALDTLEATDRLTLTGGARLNVAAIRLRDQLGTALNGDSTYTRINPMAGATYKISPDITAYGSYAEANRAPTPLELGCASPTTPCLIDNFLVADPPLKQVVSRTFEGGLRGSFALPFLTGRFAWTAGGFRTTNSNDILNVPSPISGRGYFVNAGDTRRQGLEAGIRYRQDDVNLYASYAYVDARFATAVTLSSPHNPTADASGTIQVRPGNAIPGIPAHRLKIGADYNVTPKWVVGADLMLVSGQYLRGDEGNSLPKLPGYGVVGLHTSYQLSKDVQVYGIVNNLFDRRYANFGTFFDTTAIRSMGFTDARTYSPGAPLTAYAGLKVSF